MDTPEEPGASLAGVAPRVAYQGAPGAFSEEAALRFSPGSAPAPYATFAEVFAAVGQGACARACVPLRNSLAGDVPEVAALLPGCGLRVVTEHDLPIRLHLMAPPGASLGGLRTAWSHPMALKQCGRGLLRLGLAPVEAFDTAGAAREVAGAADPTRAAVAALRAAALYGLVVLAAHIQDEATNTTRFAVLSR